MDGVVTAVNDYLEQKVKNHALMELVDCLNINVSDHHDGYGMMDGSFVTSGPGGIMICSVGN